MSTRGRLIVGGQEYYISSDAYPKFAKRIFREALRWWKGTSGKYADEFVATCNEIAGFAWIQKFWSESSKRTFGWPFEEYRWKVNLRTGKVSYTKPKPTERQLEHERRVISKHFGPETAKSVLKSLIPR